MVTAVGEDPTLGLREAGGVVGAWVLGTFAWREQHLPFMTGIAYPAKRLRSVVDAEVERIVQRWRFS
jgi:hypothetical protein